MDKYEEGALLGEGQFGHVVKATVKAVRVAQGCCGAPVVRCRRPTVLHTLLSGKLLLRYFEQQTVLHCICAASEDQALCYRLDRR
jgi:hypothetical protein